MLSIPTAGDELLEETEAACATSGARVLRLRGAEDVDARLGLVAALPAGCLLAADLALRAGHDPDQPAWTDEYYRVARGPSAGAWTSPQGVQPLPGPRTRRAVTIPGMSDYQELAATGRAIVDAARYLTLATADHAGRPWASPVWFAHGPTAVRLGLAPGRRPLQEHRRAAGGLARPVRLRRARRQGQALYGARRPRPCPTTTSRPPWRCFRPLAGAGRRPPLGAGARPGARGPAAVPRGRLGALHARPSHGPRAGRPPARRGPLGAGRAPTRMRTCVRVAPGGDPARRPRRVLRVGGAARRPAAARPAGDRRRRRRAGGQLRGQGVRRAHRDGRRRPGGCARTRSWCRRGSSAYIAASRRCSRSSGTPRRWSRASRSTRRSSTCAGCAVSRHAGRDRRAAAARRARAGRPAHHRRRGPHQVPGQGGQRRRQARRAAGRAARRRAGVPAPAAGRAAVGRRPGHRRASCTTRGIATVGDVAGLAEPALVSMLGRGVGPAPARPGAQPRPAAGAGRPAARLDRLAARARPRAAARRGDRRRRWSAWSTGSPGGCARPAGRPHGGAAPALRRLHPGHPLAHPAAGDGATPRACWPRCARCCRRRGR